MSTITINDELYRNAEKSARLSNVSIHSFIERAIRWAVNTTTNEESHAYKLKSVDELHPVVRDLIGIAKDHNNKGKKVDADKARMEYLKEKYGL